MKPPLQSLMVIIIPVRTVRKSQGQDRHCRYLTDVMFHDGFLTKTNHYTGLD